jgi:hypothetical protein
MSAADIDTPGLKEILWHKMREDLKAYIPDVANTNLLLCPTCCRFLPFEHFDVEHIIPQQALADDPPEARVALPKNERATTILLCKKNLLIKGRELYANGCNSWKGRFYDKFLREIFNSTIVNGGTFTSRHHTALFSACYLGLFARYGYQITLVPSGVIMRKQFFNPNDFIKEVPLKCQMSLSAAAPTTYDEQRGGYWIPPFKFTTVGNFCPVVVRNTGIYLPLSRDPEIPLARMLPFAPSKYKFRPDFRTVFH